MTGNSFLNAWFKGESVNRRWHLSKRRTKWESRPAISGQIPLARSRLIVRENVKDDSHDVIENAPRKNSIPTREASICSTARNI